MSGTSAALADNKQVQAAYPGILRATPTFPSWPGLTRPSTPLPPEEQDVDARHKAGHDEPEKLPNEDELTRFLIQLSNSLLQTRVRDPAA
jgi:hypothetical protein